MSLIFLIFQDEFPGWVRIYNTLKPSLNFVLHTLAKCFTHSETVFYCFKYTFWCYPKSCFISFKTALSATCHRIMILCDVWNLHTEQRLHATFATKQQLKTAHGGTHVYSNGHVAPGTCQLVARSPRVYPGEPLKDTATPIRPLLGGSKLGRSINCLMQKACHIELEPHSCLITHFHLHHFFSIAPSPRVQQHPSAGTSILVRWKKRERASGVRLSGSPFFWGGGVVRS